LRDQASQLRKLIAAFRIERTGAPAPIVSANGSAARIDG
jgi:hypothetical protein